MVVLKVGVATRPAGSRTARRTGSTWSRTTARARRRRLRALNVSHSGPVLRGAFVR
jgi:hypothetical protein